MQTALRLPDQGRIRPAHGNHPTDAPWAKRLESAVRACCSGVATVLLRYCELVGPLYIRCTSVVHPLYMAFVFLGSLGHFPGTVRSVSRGNLQQFFLRIGLISTLGLLAHCLDALGLYLRSFVPPFGVLAHIGQDRRNLLVGEGVFPRHHSPIEALPLKLKRSAYAVQHRADDAPGLRLLNPLRLDQGRKLPGGSFSIGLMAGDAGGLVVNPPAFLGQAAGAGDGLPGFHFLKAVIRRIDRLVEPAAVLVEIDHPPVKNDEEEDDQPDGNRRPARLGLGFRSYRQRLLRLMAHFAGAFVGGALVEVAPGTAGAFVEAGGAGGAGTLSGASNSGASARRLIR